MRFAEQVATFGEDEVWESTLLSVVFFGECHSDRLGYIVIARSN